MPYSWSSLESLLLVTVGVTRSLAEWTRTFVLRELIDDMEWGKKGERCPDGHRASENYRITSNKTPDTDRGLFSCG